MPTWVDHLHRAWSEFVGPEATRTDHVITAAASVAGLLGGGWAARKRGAGPVATGLVSFMAVDIVGGVYVNNTRASARWYERPGQGARQHLGFAALHVHPVVVAYVDSSTGHQQHIVRWSLAHYGYLMASTLAIRRFHTRRRGLGVALTAGGLVLDRVLGPSQTAPWFAWCYYPKLLMGHAAASLWTDVDLAERSDAAGAASPSRAQTAR